jgi:Ca2+-transporting ATPase
MHLIIPGIFLVGLLTLSFVIMRDFFITITWALIISYLMWPAYLWLKSRLNNRANLSAGIMTAVISLLIFFIFFWLSAMLHQEIKVAYQLLVDGWDNKTPLQVPDSLRKIPWLGTYLQEELDRIFKRISEDQASITSQLLEMARQWLGEFGNFVGHIGGYAINLGFVIVTIFFCFRDGENVRNQLKQGLFKFLGEYQQVYLNVVGDTTKAVVYGLVLAALGQGITAGLGYAVAGVKAPVLFGVITTVLALIPWGAMLAWVSIVISLLANGQTFSGIGLLLWGVFVISTIDNVIRPLVISGTTKVPLLVVMFGVFGGLSAFGIVGLFIGPVILSVLLSVWRAWLQQQN